LKARRVHITCSFAFDDPFSASKKEPAQPVVQTRFHLTIVERTPERVVAILKEMIARAQAAPQQDLPAARIGRTLWTRRCRPLLIQLTHIGAVERRAAAVAALPLVPTRSTLDASIVASRIPLLPFAWRRPERSEQSPVLAVCAMLLQACAERSLLLRTLF